MNVNGNFKAGRRPDEIQENSERAVVPYTCHGRQNAPARCVDMSDEDLPAGSGNSRTIAPRVIVVIDDEDWKQYNDIRNGRVMDGPGNSRASRSLIAILALIWEEECEYITDRLYALEKEGYTYFQIFQIIEQEIKEREPALKAERAERERLLRDPETRKNIQIRTCHEALMVHLFEQNERQDAYVEQAREKTRKAVEETKKAIEMTALKEQAVREMKKTRERNEQMAIHAQTMAAPMQKSDAKQSKLADIQRENRQLEEELKKMQQLIADSIEEIQQFQPDISIPIEEAEQVDVETVNTSKNDAERRQSRRVHGQGNQPPKMNKSSVKGQNSESEPSCFFG
ncbi:MAG: hypothetical protein LBI69_02000 [Puniceicoccales bacterium]|nr:hypothetical protein [Puniceicoccales bacterium]